MASSKIVVAKHMQDHLNSWPNKPTFIELEHLEKKPFAMMIQLLAGKPQEKSYVDGTKIIQWPFAVYARIRGDDSKGRYDAVQTLTDLDEWVSSAPLPDLGKWREAQKIEMTSLPSLAATYDDGTQDYQAVFSLKYKQEKE